MHNTCVAIGTRRYFLRMETMIQIAHSIPVDTRCIRSLLTLYQIPFYTVLGLF